MTGHPIAFTVLSALLPQGELPPHIMIPPEAVDMVRMFFTTIASIALGIPIIRALTRRFIDRPRSAPAIDVDVRARLERMEQAIDAVAIEVERISEAQRFQTRLMTDGASTSRGAAPRAAETPGSAKDQPR